MNIHEYQAKTILKEFGVKVLNGYLVENKEEIEQKAKKIDGDIKVLKAQIHAGGRGKAGGVKIVSDIRQCVYEGEKLLGKKLITKQTAKDGTLVRKLYIEEGCDIQKEYYLSYVLDRKTSLISVIASKEGGTSIEEVAEKRPESIIVEKINPLVGFNSFQVRGIIEKLEIPQKAQKSMEKTLENIYRCYIEKDCNMIEINPLVLTKQEDMVALDAKMSFDDNALFRQERVLKLRDIYEEDEKEIEASKFKLSYVALDGNIGCMVNGAGLAMATMDSIQYVGGKPANFLDVGGSATTETVTNAFRLILSDSNVKGIFVNIFGGIMKCNTIADGIVKAAREIHIKVPLVVRLEGTNEIEGKLILNSSGLDIYAVNNMDDGAKLIVELTKEDK